MAELAKLNEQLRRQPYVGGYQPTDADRKQIEKIFGGDMKVLQWAGRMAAYYPAERTLLSGAKGAATSAQPQLGDRDVGGVEGCVDGTAIDKLESISRVGQWTTQNVRQTFVDFFTKKKGLTFVPSSPVVPIDDPTLLFTNAGMNQFKPNFLGTVKPGTPEAAWKGAANSQKCIRAGGKHNDLDDVGKDTYHHTYFEMLGNWSFGDYFKEETIAWAWELLTKVFKIPEDRLYVTYFHDDDSGLEPDFETKNIWKKYVAEDRILKGSMGDNFWEMGDTGPCGPCTEIHYDRIGGRNAADRVNAEPGDPMVIEVWNLVFIQFNREKAGPDGLRKLPAKHVDTGMGLERITSILQGVYSNYNIDLFWRIFAAIQQQTKYEKAYHSADISTDAVIAYRVIADHARTITIAMSDGGTPSNVGRGYVLRRIIRRAVRFGKEFLKAPLGFFSELVPVVVEELGAFFQELKKPGNADRIKFLIREEEKEFDKAWATGLKHFKEALKKCRGGLIAGEDAWILHDRYGFPVDLTQLMAEKSGCPAPFVDMEAFEASRPRNGGGRVSNKLVLSTFHIDELQSAKVPATCDAAKYVWKPIKARVVAILDRLSEKLVKGCGAADEGALKAYFDKQKPTKKGKKSPDDEEETADIREAHVAVMLDSTNFYYESGGQIWDTGVLVGKHGKVTVTKVPAAMGGYICHVGKVSGTVSVDDELELQPDYERRLNIGANHTATHELNRALREVLERRGGSYVEVNQKGSLVEPESLRFDFSWNEKMTAEQLEQAEEVLNAAVQEDRKVYSAELPLAQAMSFHGLRQMFGEKYPDPVRVVSIGVPIEELQKNPKNEAWINYSLEFCGGTHLKSLGEVQQACIVAEDALMRGVRRMSVLTRGAAQKATAELKSYCAQADELLSRGDLTLETCDAHANAINKLQHEFGDKPLPLVGKNRLREKLEAGVKEVHAKKKQLLAARKAEAEKKGEELGEHAKKSGTKFAVVAVDELGDQVLQSVIDGVRKSNADCAVFLTATDKVKGKTLAVAALPPSLVKAGKSAVDWMKHSCGKGGGKPDKSQMGLRPADVDKTLEAAKEWAGKL
eukprot:TRINITY_DN35607_c0_g1_i1.p1 TRINITY_DN35607_c0_g1~~TRINITY_DN35607_c0_g1_i1.p1  ORF type:complete len:1081 (+),score=399.56 TRINITY_DN35607_c0_g1_i1:111-3353(+)